VELTDADGRLIGPFNAMLFSPAIGAKLQALGADIRYSARLAARSREIAILEVARARRSEFEWHAHARIGRAAGLTEDEIDAIRTGAVVALPPSEAIVRDVAKMLVTTRDLDDDLFGRAEPVLGVAALSEIITLVGYYDLLALSLRVWRTPLPPGAEPVFGEQ
jgi:alkylhydroperoxidase family enzyme